MSGGGGADEFGRAASRAAVARVLQSAGFSSAHRSAVDALADVLLRYLRLLGGAAASGANHAGRSVPNVFDVVAFLEETGETYQGFEGASDSTRRRCLLGSGVVKDLVAFAGDADDGKPQSVRRLLPRFPVEHAPSRSGDSFAAVGRGSGMKHVPQWLPAFPEPHTYARDGESCGMVGRFAADEVDQAWRQRKAEKSLLGLQRQLALAGGSGISTAMAVEDDCAGKGKELDNAGIKGNPFLESAWRYGEKDVLEVALPSAGKKHSVLEAFAPAFTESDDEKVDEGRDQDHGRGRKRMVPKERPPVYFRIGTDRKSRVMALNSSALENHKGPWFLEDDGKRRALSILAEPVEEPS